MRSASFDIMKGIAILLVIAGHIDGLSILERNLIYSFHMPLFFLLSGYFYKLKPQKFSSEVGSTFKRLIVPYLVTCACLFLFSVLLAIKKHNPSLMIERLLSIVWGGGYYHMSPVWGDIRYIGPIWFLISLFWCKLSFSLILRYCKRYASYMCFAIGIAAVLLDVYVINLPLGILPGLSALMFFYIGYWAKNKKISSISKVSLIIVWPCAILYATFVAQLPDNPCLCINRFACLPLDVAGACGGTLLIYVISCFIEGKLVNAAKFLQWCGKMSLCILCIHVLDQNTSLLSTLCRNFLSTDSFFIVFPVRATFAIVLTWVGAKAKIFRTIFQIR